MGGTGVGFSQKPIVGINEVIGVISVLIAIAIFYLGIRYGRHQERERRAHELQMEADRRRRELASKVADEYVGMTRKNYDAGPHAMARLGLHELGSDAVIREAIHEMRAHKLRSGRWSPSAEIILQKGSTVTFSHVYSRRALTFRTEKEANVHALELARAWIDGRHSGPASPTPSTSS